MKHSITTRVVHWRPMYLILLFMFQLFIVKQRYASASHQVPENQRYSKITYMMLLENTHVTNTVLKEDYKMGRNLFQVQEGVCVCVCVCACACA